ncbi:BamA/TamA family outer membrane protein [Flavobacterium sp. CYK-55]|uniref:translocation and assembly module lipoprotein TamL n=1 Tax=Flavobacterium sp. CYK-55 TaxID=2835529 RepID=UPI0020BE6802|nr:BamA/TamA family outer membrane protein [Flavobacterium sp. CYK-55]
MIFAACNTLKRVPKNKRLLTKSEILVNNKKVNTEEVSALVYQKPNTSILGFNLRLHLYNMANLKHDSIYKAKFVKNPKKYKRMSKLLSAKQVNRLGHSFWYEGIHEFLKKTGEAPVILDKKSTDKSLQRLKSHYFNRGFFDVKASYEIDSSQTNKAKIKYFVETGKPYIIDTIKTTILTPALDSLYKKNAANSIIKTGKPYKTSDLEDEKSRITTQFRNNGGFNFQPTNVSFDIDTLNGNHKANINLKIDNYSYNDGDSIKTRPFNLYKISEVNIHTDYNAKDSVEVVEKKTTYQNFNLFSKGKLKYRPKAITDAVFVTQGSYFSDTRSNLTTRYLSNLKVFNYPSIRYRVNPADSLGQSLIADIYLTQREKYSFGYGIDFTHSNIQDFGISGTLSFGIKNIFNGAETFEIATRGNIGSSKDLANPDNRFFNVSDYGIDMKLNFPRIFMFFNTEKIIPKSMIPSTSVTMGFSKQKNIGLDKENFTGAMTYTWTPRRTTTMRFDLFNIQYVKNVNPGNYFNVYQSSYVALNDLAVKYNANPTYFNSDNELYVPSGINSFVSDINNGTITTTTTDLKTINNIIERANRLTENNLIFASNITLSKTTKSDIYDETFHVFRTKFESAGNFLSLLANLSKQTGGQNANKTIFEVAYSQYLKGELEYIKHWDMKNKKVLAFRSFVGLAVPYGNSESIPFSRSYFAGGTNDNRAWQAYSLGPGSRSSLNDFNEANLKIAVSSEFRFNFFERFNGALFVDTGNIWNVLDNVEDEKSVFEGFKSLQDLAVGSGFGLRFDATFFVFRIDFGFKTYNPAETANKKWFRDYNFANSVLNIGINYPF